MLRSTSTRAQFTGLPVVPATFQVTVRLLPAVQVTAVLGWVTTKGPAPPATETTILSCALQPAPGALSRTVTRKLNVRETFASISQLGVGLLPESTVESIGNQRCGSLDGNQGLKLGPLVLLAEGGCVEDWGFICSQL